MIWGIYSNITYLFIYLLYANLIVVGPYMKENSNYIAYHESYKKQYLLVNYSDAGYSIFDFLLFTYCINTV